MIMSIKAAKKKAKKGYLKEFAAEYIEHELSELKYIPDLECWTDGYYSTAYVSDVVSELYEGVYADGLTTTRKDVRDAVNHYLSRLAAAK